MNASDSGKWGHGVHKPIRPESDAPARPSPAQFRTFRERAAAGLPIFSPNDHPDIYEQHAQYRCLSQIYLALGQYLTHWKLSEQDEDYEITFTQLAKILQADPAKPGRVLNLLPPSLSTPETKTSRHVWKWADVASDARRLMVAEILRKLAEVI